MTEEEALDILRAEGHAVSSPDESGRVRIWIRGTDDCIEVEPGRELWDLAEGKIKPEELLDIPRVIKRMGA